MIYFEVIMIKKTSCVWNFYKLLVAVLFIAPVSLYAQDRDFTTWASTGFKYKVKPAFTLSGKLLCLLQGVYYTMYVIGSEYRISCLAKQFADISHIWPYHYFSK